MKALFLFALVTSACAQLPVARLWTVFPPGAQIGVPTDVTVTGSDLEDLRELRFSTPNITATLKGGSHFTVTAATNIAAGIYDARVIGRFGASNPRAFIISREPQHPNSGTNKSAPSAQELTIGSIVNGRATAGAIDFFKFKVAKDQKVTIQCETRRIDSRMEPVLVLLENSGRELKRTRGTPLEHTFLSDGEVILKVHDAQFRGGEEYWYHLAIRDGATMDYAFPPPFLDLPKGAMQEVESTNLMQLTAPCEVDGQFFPKGDVDLYQFDVAKGDVYWIEMISHRLGLKTDPFVLVQRVVKNDNGEETVSDAQEMHDNDANAGGPEFNTATRDPAWRLEAKEAGSYRLRVRDLFGVNISDARRIYRLSIHKEKPDVRLIAYAPAPPPLNKDTKEALTSGVFLRRGDTIPIRVLALRRDGFAGDIEVTAHGLPTGVSAAPCKIKAGANEALLMISSSDDTPAWTGPVRIICMGNEARYGTLIWNVPDYNNEAVQNRLTQELLITVSGSEAAPLAIRTEKLVETLAGSKVTVPLQILRRHEFNSGLKFKAFIEPAKEFEVDGKATNAAFEIDLAQMKLGPGAHWFSVYATSPGRYRRITPEEAKSTEEEIKKLKESLGATTEAPKKEAVNNQIKALEARLTYRDLTATVYTSFGLNVTAPVSAAKSP